MSTPLNSLTETQILSEIRRAFEGQALEGIDTDAIIDSSNTLEELLIKIRTAIEIRNSADSESLG